MQIDAAGRELDEQCYSGDRIMCNGSILKGPQMRLKTANIIANEDQNSKNSRITVRK
jgi:hypothetical protein